MGDRVTVKVNDKPCYGTFQRYGECNAIVDFDEGGISFVNIDSISINDWRAYFDPDDKYPDQLLGRLVLHSFGMTYSEKYNHAIRKITKVTKTYFKIGDENAQYDLSDGRQRGLGGKQNMATISYCTLITDTEAAAYRDEWKKNKEVVSMKDEIKTKIDSLTHEQLTEIMNIIKK